MALTNAFYEAVNSGNVTRVRIMMKNSLLTDPTGAEFAEMERAAASMPGLYDQHDGQEFITDKSKWTNEYMDQVMVKLISNFSKERISHVKDLVHHLIPVVAPATHNKVSFSNPETRCRVCQNNHGEFVTIGIGAAAGATVGGIIASVVGATATVIVGSAIAGAAVGGAISAAIVSQGD